MEAVNSLPGYFGNNHHSSADKFIQNVYLLKWSPLQSKDQCQAIKLHRSRSVVTFCFPQYDMLFQGGVQPHSRVRLYDPMDCSTPGFPVLHCLQELAQIHVHWVSDAIQSSHPLLPLSPFAFNLSQHQGLFPLTWLSLSSGESIGASASVLPMDADG